MPSNLRKSTVSFAVSRLSLAYLALLAGSPAYANTPPTAEDDSVFHNGEVIVVDVLANDTEPDGEALTVTLLSTTCSGVLSEDFGLVTLQPGGSTSEDCSITYTVQDERGEPSEAATVDVVSGGLIFRDGFESGDASIWSEQEVQS